MSWQIFLAVSIFSEAFGRVLQRVVMSDKKSDSIASGILYQLIAGLGLLVFVFIRGFSLPDLRPLFLNLLLVPIFWGVGNILVFKSLRSTEASVFTILFTSRTIWLIVLALAFLGEHFTLQQAFGTVLIITSVLLISSKKKKLTLRGGEWLALLAAIFFACAVTNDAFIVRSIDPFLYMAYNFLIAGVFVWLVYLKKTPLLKKIIGNPKHLLNVSLLSLLYAASAVTYLLAYRIGRNAAQIGAIYPVSGILTVVLAVMLLRERSDLWRKIVAIIISILGVLLIG